jgi:hypothetical protein
MAAVFVKRGLSGVCQASVVEAVRRIGLRSDAHGSLRCDD